MIENPVPWPNGAKCAVAFTFDIDTDSFLHLIYGDKIPDKVAITSWTRYDEIAVPRLLGLYRDYGLKQTFFYPAWCMERHPRLVEAILRDGHEIGHHGYIHEAPNRLANRDLECEWLGRAVDTIKRMTGAPPRGYRAPAYQFSRHTASILAEMGFRYDASLMNDDVPCIYESSAGEIIGLPSHFALDDWPQYVSTSDLNYTLSIRSPEEAVKTFLAEFDVAYKYGGMWIAVWHPWISARLSRAEAVRSMIEMMQARGDVWIASMEDIATHIQQLVYAGEWSPRRVRLPYYEESIPATELPFQERLATDI